MSAVKRSEKKWSTALLSVMQIAWRTCCVLHRSVQSNKCHRKKVNGKECLSPTPPNDACTLFKWPKSFAFNLHSYEIQKLSHSFLLQPLQDIIIENIQIHSFFCVC